LQRDELPKNAADILHLQQEVDHLLEVEDVKWKQRVKRRWFQHGDRNMGYFHAWASYRRKTNRIAEIRDDSGQIWSSPRDIGSLLSQYFQQLFSTSGAREVDGILEVVSPCVTTEMNVVLPRPFQSDELKVALFQIQPLTAPGPDGFGVCSFQNHWDSVGAEVCEAALNFLNNGIFDPSLNLTHFALIPKKSRAVSVSDFRPISLCNVLYKIIAKIISPFQSAFVPGRLISDNIRVAYEALHTMSSRMKGKKGFMAIKLDMSNAYDRVEWSFLEAMMLRLGFAVQWVQLIMRCVSSVSYAVLLNGSPLDVFSLSRGLRQGDHLSPYLFLLCAEGLSSLLSKACHDGLISGTPISARGVHLSHPLFADDSLLFCRSNWNEWRVISQLLQRYEMASGQKLNNEKTFIFYSINTPQDFKDLIHSTAGIPAVASFERYLGLPAMVGRLKQRTFAGIVSRVRKRLKDWKEKSLSQAGREILLKAVAQAIPDLLHECVPAPKVSVLPNSFLDESILEGKKFCL
jgi:hypothetical protein